MTTKKTGFFQTYMTLTLADIAGVCDVDVKTVRRWIDKMSTGDGQNVQGISDIKMKCIEAGERGIAAELTLKEAMDIIEIGRGTDFAGALKDNAVNTELDKKRGIKIQGKLPSGPQLKGMVEMYGAEEARKRIDFVLGYKAAPEPLQLPAPRLSKAAYAVEMKEQQKARDREWQKAHERLLF